MTPACTRRWRARSTQQAIDTVIPVSSPRAAEMVKLLENTFRSVNIGLVNEVALMCDRLGVDVWEVIDAAATKPFGFMPFYPGPGLGGHCIPIDPLYLSWKLKTLNYRARFIELAGEINSAMPEYVVRARGRRPERPREERQGQPHPGHRRHLQARHRRRARVAGARHHPHPREARGAQVDATTIRTCPRSPWTTCTLRSEDLMPAVREADLVVIVTDHSAFAYPEIVEAARVVLDTRNATRGIRSDQDPEDLTGRSRRRTS